MKKQLTSRISLEQIGKRLEIRIKANRSFATLFLMPVIFVLFVLVIYNFLEQATSEAPLWWIFMLSASIPLLGGLFLRQWLWEYRGWEILYFDLLTDTLRYHKQGSFWIGSDQTWTLSSLQNLAVKKRGFLEGNLYLALPPYCSLIGEAQGIPIRMGDSIGGEEGWRIWMEIRSGSFLKDDQFHPSMSLPKLKNSANK